MRGKKKPEWRVEIEDSYGRELFMAIVYHRDCFINLQILYGATAVEAEAAAVEYIERVKRGETHYLYDPVTGLRSPYTKRS